MDFPGGQIADLSQLKVFKDSHGYCSEGYIYCIGEVESISLFNENYTNWLKVGKSGNVKERLENLQTANPRPLRMVYLWKISTNVSEAEKAVHTQLANAKEFQVGGIDGGGGKEWYQVSADTRARNLFLQRIQDAVTTHERWHRQLFASQTGNSRFS